MRIPAALGFISLLGFVALGATASWGLTAGSEAIVREATSQTVGQAAEQSAGPRPSELRLDASLIEGFVQSIFFTDQGRYHFREYSQCSYEFLQNPDVVVEDGVLQVTAEYYRRRATEGLGGCVGGPGVNTNVTMTARLSAAGSAVAIEVAEVTTDTLPQLTGMILQLAGVELPMTQQFDLLAVLNDLLYGKLPFGIVSLDIHEVLMENDSVLLRLTMQLGIW